MYEDHGLTELFIVSDGGADLNKLSMADALPGVLATVNGQVSMLIVNILAIKHSFSTYQICLKFRIADFSVAHRAAAGHP